MREPTYNSAIYLRLSRDDELQGGRFVKAFTLISWAFFAIVVIPGFLLSSWKMLSLVFS